MLLMVQTSCLSRSVVVKHRSLTCLGELVLTSPEFRRIMVEILCGELLFIHISYFKS